MEGEAAKAARLRMVTWEYLAFGELGVKGYAFMYIYSDMWIIPPVPVAESWRLSKWIYNI